MLSYFMKIPPLCVQAAFIAYCSVTPLPHCVVPGHQCGDLGWFWTLAIGSVKCVE